MTMTANPRALDGWLYPTPAFAGACLAHPPLTKGRNKTALLSGFPACGQGNGRCSMSDYATLIRPTQNLKRRDSSLRSE